MMCRYRFVMIDFKQKTAYDMRISDWSSDVCSSDLKGRQDDGLHEHERRNDDRKGDRVDIDNRIHPSRNRRTHQISPLQMSRRELLPKFVSGFARRDLVGAMALAGGGLAVAALPIPNVWDSMAPAGDRPINSTDRTTVG